MLVLLIELRHIPRSAYADDARRYIMIIFFFIFFCYYRHFMRHAMRLSRCLIEAVSC